VLGCAEGRAIDSGPGSLEMNWGLCIDSPNSTILHLQPQLIMSISVHGSWSPRPPGVGAIAAIKLDVWVVD